MTSITVLDYVIVAVFGLVVGSFLNVVILRFDDLKSILNSRSHCPKCKRVLTWYELVPFFSYLILWGKCRTCKGNISVQYPLVELGTAGLFTALFYKIGFNWELIPALLIASILIIIFTYDILYYLIADILVWLAIGVWVIWLAVQYFGFHTSHLFLLNSLYGGLILGGFLALLAIFSKEKWMGAGDIKLGFLLGAIASFPGVLVGSFSAFTLGSLVGVALLLFHRKKIKDQVPFAPFLIVGMYIAWFFGEQILNWYLGNLGM